MRTTVVSCVAKTTSVGRCNLMCHVLLKLLRWECNAIARLFKVCRALEKRYPHCNLHNGYAQSIAESSRAIVLMVKMDHSVCTLFHSTGLWQILDHG